jgi:adenine-specific DNA-methyltransferase
MSKNYNTDTEKEKLLAEIERLKKELKKKKKYGLVWEDKPEDVVELCKTKLPILKEVKSKEIITDKNKPVNLLIEGDNFHALSVLNYTHAGEIDVIYIDPPYNTGNKSWTYNNDYVEKDDSFRHSKWLSFISKRLILSKYLLKNDGVIIVTIDDYEIGPLRLLMDNIFGDNNRLGLITIMHNPRGRSDDLFFATSHEYALIYGRNATITQTYKLRLTEEQAEDFPFEDEISRYRLLLLKRTGSNSTPKERPNLYYPIYFNPKTKEISIVRKKGFVEILPIDRAKEKRVWRWGKETLMERASTEIIIQGEDDEYTVYTKDRIKEGRKPKTVWVDPKYDASSHGTILLQNILGVRKSFDYPKSIYAVKDILEITLREKPYATVLDFFAGSGTTGHSLLMLNTEDNGNRKFILNTNNESNNSNNYRIAEDICYPRIQKVIKGYKISRSDQISGLGGNLKYYKTDFVDGEPTDKNMIKLTKEATEMLCIKEGTFELVSEQKDIKIFKNGSHYTGIIFDQLAIPKFKKAIKGIKAKFSVYIFSLSDETFDEEFSDIKQNIKLSPIPEAILRVYRRIFR